MGRNIVVQVPTVTIDMTGMSYMTYAGRYRAAAQGLESTAAADGFDPVPFQLYCVSIELLLKAFLWYSRSASKHLLKLTYRHDLVKLWHDAKKSGINRYARVTPLRDEIISLVGPYYKDRKFCYLDVVMVFRGYSSLKAQPRAIPTLRRLSLQLGRSLEKPVISAS